MNRKILVVILALAFVVTFIFFSDSMDASAFQVHEGVVVKNGELVATGLKVQAAGGLKRKFLAGSTITGTLRIDNQPPYYFVLTNSKGVYEGTVYEEQNNNMVEVGKISTTSGLKTLRADLTVIEAQYGAGSVLYAPAKTLEDVQTLDKKFQ